MGESIDIRTYSPQTLAFMGDAVFEIIVRERLVRRGNKGVDALNREKAQIVKAASQAKIADMIMDRLSEEEITIYKRGRNTKGRKAKNVIIHNQSTGFEAIIGTLHLEGNDERINEIFAYFVEAVDDHKLKKLRGK